jgi:co-chaperonin GroES (HSP10)
MKIHTPTEYEQYEPIGDKVLLVLPRAEPEKLEDVGGILVDQMASLKKNPIREVEVVSVGPECKQVCAGDTVLFNKLNASPHPFGDNDLYFMPESHLICVTKRGDAPRVVRKPCKCAGAPDEGSS